MVATARPNGTFIGLVVPTALLGALLVLIASQLDWPRPTADGAATLAPPTTIVQPRPYTYRETGDFYRGTVQLDGPLVSVDSPPALEIMTFQVTATDYQACVTAGACREAAPLRQGTGNLPVTGVSFNDASDYADWLSAATGETWRLPTIAEWVFAAAERAVDPGLGLDDPSADPTERWIALYEREAELGANALAAPEALGSFGYNSAGVADMGGSVWEWTATCAGRTTLDAAGAVLSSLPSCGVRYLEGRHRTQMTIFVRDARTGGCSTGTPPDNLGFRLVREPGWFEALLGTLRGR